MAPEPLGLGYTTLCGNGVGVWEVGFLLSLPAAGRRTEEMNLPFSPSGVGRKIQA